MKKKIILIAFVVLIIGGIGIYLFLGNTKDKSNTKTNTTTKEVSLSDDVDWSNYDTYNITLSDEAITIDKEGVYYISGSLTDNQILVNTSDNVKLVLNNVTIKNTEIAAIMLLINDLFVSAITLSSPLVTAFKYFISPVTINTIGTNT